VVSKMIQPFDIETDAMIEYGFRYCLGRQTYAVGDCVNYLIKHWEQLRTETQWRIRKDILNAFDTKRYGSETDRARWAQILDLP
jgi:hypothetical protein